MTRPEDLTLDSSIDDDGPSAPLKPPFEPTHRLEIRSPHCREWAWLMAVGASQLRVGMFSSLPYPMLAYFLRHEDWRRAEWCPTEDPPGYAFQVVEEPPWSLGKDGEVLFYNASPSSGVSKAVHGDTCTITITPILLAMFPDAEGA